MKKVKFRNAGRAVYALLCAGLLVVGVASYAGYKTAVNSVTEGLITSKDEAEIPELDYSAVDAVLDGIEKDRQDAEAEKAENNAESQAPTVNNGDVSGTPNDIFPVFPEAPETLEEPANDALVDITDELEALYYEQAVIMPINGEIISAYSEGELVKTSGGVWRTHDGIDIAAQEGTKVKAMTSGTVTDVYDDPVWGCCVVIDHGNTLRGCYYGLSENIAVNVGDRVNSGDVIGEVGNTADIESDIASHLHFALKYENRWIDPVSYIEPMK